MQDSNDFLSKVETTKNIPANCLLVTMDVKSLYLNIPNSKGIFTVKAIFESYPLKILSAKGSHYILSSDSNIK